ncbi:ankyrin repeat and fibronectin type-III domain-containing protein 1 isoform X1 [Synchiropus splendidus]|uniref:ankyrin repeat and fibronectin type-III domain-containing protein 1 isoform X1 n=1 Tax=Synchiropus splendidus TaxID=270530 RepID=UPI00237DCABC|nr:ankyrin repeat and fibronectin type-III domain-containing protein 1 isoform X1 [Synchiropus splendidus]
MSLDSKTSGLLLSDPRTSCLFQTADEKDDTTGDESVLEMLSSSKFTDLESWLCMPSLLLLPSVLDSSHSSSCSSLSSTPSPASRHSICSETVDGARFPDLSTLTNTPRPLLSSTPFLSSYPPSHGGSSIRKRRRLAASRGGLHLSASDSLHRDSSLWEVKGEDEVGSASSNWACQRPVLRKTVSVDERVLRPKRDRQLLSRLRSRQPKASGVNSLQSCCRFEARNTKRRQRSTGDDFITELKHLLHSGVSRSSLCLDRLVPGAWSPPMLNLQLSQTRKCPPAPPSPSAAKRLYRNLSEKLRGSSTSFEEANTRATTMVASECLLEAVEQQDLDLVQVLLLSIDDLDLNSPDSRGLTPLDIAVMTNNTPIAKLLLRAGAKESPHFTTIESREAHLSSLMLEAEQRVSALTAQAQKDGLSLDACQKDKTLRSWEWRSKLYKRMRAALRLIPGPPDPPTMVRLSVSSSTSLTISFHEPQGLNSGVITKFRVEWSCLKDFSLVAGQEVLDDLQTPKLTIRGLATGRVYFVRVSAYNLKGWGPPAPSLPPSAAPSNWRECVVREPRQRVNIEAMERLLQQVRVTHTHYCGGDAAKLHNSSRKQSVSRSLKHLFNSSSKFIKTLKRGTYLAAIFYHKDKVLVTAEDQIPIVEVDDTSGSSLMQDFLWFTKLSCMWEDVRWLRQTTSVSMSSSSTLQSRHKMLTAAAQLQNLLGTHDLGRVHYEPIKDRHGNVLMVTVRDLETPPSGKMMSVSKLQSQRKSMSTPEEPYALDVLVITLQDILTYQRRSSYRLAPGLYLGFLKLSSSVDQIRVLVSQRTPNMLCHTRIRENANVSREEWAWLQSLTAQCDQDLGPDSHAPLLFYELQTAIKSLLKLVNAPSDQVHQFRLYTNEVVELGHGVAFLLLLPPADHVCAAPGQSQHYTLMSGFIQLPLQMFELVHFSCYQKSFISLYCRLSSVLDLGSLVTQQAQREALTDEEVTTSRQRHQMILDYIQQLDEMRRSIRWINDALQFARDRQTSAGVPITFLVDLANSQHKNESTSSAVDYLATPSPSPDRYRRETISDSLLCSDDDGSSEVFLPTDSDYDSCEALSPRDLDHLRSPTQDISQKSLHSLGGSVPNMMQVHELRTTSPAPPASAMSVPQWPSVSGTLPRSPSGPLSPRFFKDLPALSDTVQSLEGLSISSGANHKAPANPPAKRKLLSRSHRGRYFSGPQRWLRGHSGENSSSLSEGVYTRQQDLDPPTPRVNTYVSQTTCILASGRHKHEQRPHVRRIFVDTEPKGWSWGSESERAGGLPGTVEVAAQDVDSDDQTNAQISEILSSTL